MNQIVSDINSVPIEEYRICPACGASNVASTLDQRQYRCNRCNLELAYLDFTASGAIRGLFGWIRGAGEIIEERYRVLSVLGQGGFGTTYLVEDLRLNGKRCALKEVPKLLFDEYESNLLSHLRHPSIPAITDRGATQNTVYLVLEFGGNRTLAGEQRQSPDQRIPLTRLLPWMRQLCEVLLYLHAQNPPVIHRDLKPDNILLDETGRIMLIDFGIAKQSEANSITRTLGRAATAGFSAPEQAFGTGTDPRSDIYSMGATFYCLLTGVKPSAAHERIAGAEVAAPSELTPGVPDRLDQVLLKALSLNVHHRQLSVREFREALDEIQPSGDIQPGTNDSSNRTRFLDTGRPANTAPPKRIELMGQKEVAKPVKKPGLTAESRVGWHRKAIWSLGSLIVFASFATAGFYWFWPDINSKNGPVLSGPANPETQFTTAIPVSPEAVSEQTHNDASQVTKHPVDTATATTPVEQIPTESAAAAFDEELKKKAAEIEKPTATITSAPAPKPVPVAIQERPSTKPKMSPKKTARVVHVTKSAGTKIPAASLPRTTKPESSVQNTSNWLIELKGSAIRRQ